MARVRHLLLASTVLLVGTVGAVQAGTVGFGFEEYAGGSASAGAFTSLNYLKSGSTLDITRSGGERFDILNHVTNPVGGSWPASWGDKHLSPFYNGAASDMFVVNISAPGDVTGVSAQYSDFGQDSGNVRFQVWSGADGTGSLLSDQSQFWSGSLPDFGTFTYSGSGIGSITFWGELGSFPNSLYWDNIEIEYTDNPAIPLPSVAGLGAAGLLALGARRRRINM